MEYDSKYGKYPPIERAGWEPLTLLEKNNFPEILFKNATPSLYNKPKEHALALQNAAPVVAAPVVAAPAEPAAPPAVGGRKKSKRNRRRKRSKKKSQRKKRSRKKRR